jgi:predicted nucleic acid-binding protein
MRVQLPDVNVLIALHHSEHPHNSAALKWFHEEGETPGRPVR